MTGFQGDREEVHYPCDCHTHPGKGSALYKIVGLAADGVCFEMIIVEALIQPERGHDKAAVAAMLTGSKIQHDTDFGLLL